MSELYHHGILGQEWGKRNGPPYPLSGGDYSRDEVREIYKRRKNKNSIYNKKHFDRVLKADKDTLSTLSYNKDRTKNTDMFYATHTKLDKHQYNALFNAPLKDAKEKTLKFKIDNKMTKDMKIASEDSAAKAFSDMYSRDRDFYNFVTDPKRMESYFVKDKYKFKAYRESKHVLYKMKDPEYKPSEKDLKTVYRMFNYVLPYDGAGADARGGKDVFNQRKKFFNEMSKRGYSGVLDTNDALYGAFKAESPVIIFDMKNVIPDKIKQTTTGSKRVSQAVLVGRKVLGV